MKTKFKLMDDGSVFVAAIPIFYSGQIVQPWDENKIRGAGMKALRCSEDHANITTYPTEQRDLAWLRAVHIAVRTGEFYRLSKIADEALFGLLMPQPVFDWLYGCGPGEPLDTFIWFLTDILARDGMDRIMEAQVEPSVFEQVYKQVLRRKKHVKGLPSFITDSEHNHFNLKIGTAYLRSDDWQRIVKQGKSDTMERCESRCDVWDAWQALSAERWEGKGLGLASVARNKARKLRKMRDS